MIILGLDPSTKTGWSEYDTTKPVSAIRAGVLKAQGDSHEQKAASIGRALVIHIKANGKPDLVTVEMPLRTLPMGARHKKSSLIDGDDVGDATPMGVMAAMVSNQIVGAIMGVVGAYNLPFEVITPSTWRKAFLGPVSRKGMDRNAWKQAVRQRCDLLGIVVTNDDMADAVGVAFAGAGTQTAKMIGARAAA